MFPFCFEWQWSSGYFIFFGLLYLALIIVGCGLIFAGIMTALQVLGFMRERHF